MPWDAPAAATGQAEGLLHAGKGIRRVRAAAREFASRRRADDRIGIGVRGLPRTGGASGEGDGR